MISTAAATGAAKTASAPRPIPPAPNGELQLDQPPPLHAALLLRHVVVARATIAPGQTELTFTLDPNEVLVRLTTVRLRILDEAGQPLEGVGVSFSSSSGGGARGKTDAQGVAVTEHVVPGLASLQISAKDRESYWTLLKVPAGGTLEAGDVVLHPAVKLSGRLVDEQGPSPARSPGPRSTA